VTALKVVNTIPVTIASEATKLLESLGPSASVLIELKYQPAVCNSAFCKPIPYISVRATKQAPQQGFVEALSGNLRVFLQEPLAELAVRRGLRLVIRPSGFWKWKKLEVTGLDPYLA
jgi:hypothetical protein